MNCFQEVLFQLNVHFVKRLDRLRKMLFVGLLILAQLTCSLAVFRGCEGRGPVCGNDGQTYKTMCQLLWARIDDKDLQVLHDGGCNGDFLSGPLDDTDGVSSYVKEIFGKLIHKFENNAKLSSKMPFGWPPLGPVFIAQQDSLAMRSSGYNGKIFIKYIK
ncbi:hypothetical protein B5X24_HaOG209617 [Helicoverpa armigera]|nr:hypothetical protein B5X24_HaOG209617 [Helicoverpa armigera]